VFLDDDDRRDFLALVGELVEGRALDVHAFCMMPTHYHLLVSTPRAELSRWMRSLSGDYVRRFNVRHKRTGLLWQGRYKAILVQDAMHLLECSRYIHLSPRRARVTTPAERYRWSSYPNYVGGPRTVPWIKTDLVLGELGGGRDKYRRYVEAGKRERLIDPFDRAVAGLALGDEEFVKRIARIVKGMEDHGDQPALRALRRECMADPHKVEELVETLFSDSGPARRGRLQLYALRKYSKLRPTEIARRHERRPAAVTMAVKALDMEAERDPDFRARLARLEKSILREK